jgi:hypothetical protein
MSHLIPNNREAIVNEYFPNLATINPDGPGIVASLSGFLGIPYQGLEDAAREGRWIDRDQYPEAFKGKYLQLGQIILGLAYDTNEPLLSELDGLPVTQSQNLKVTWNEYRFAEGMFDREPEEGTARTMLTTTESFEKHLLRRSKAIHVEKGHFYTPEGQQKMILQMQQLQKALHLTFTYDALMEMIHTRVRDVKWRMNQWYNTLVDEQTLYMYTNQFISWQKLSDGAKKTISEATDILEMRSTSRPSMMYAPRGIENLIKGAENSDQLNYDKVGVLAEQRRAMDASRMTTIAGLRLHFTRKYDGFKVGQAPIEPMVSERILGEFYQMPPMRPSHPYYQLENTKNNQIPGYQTSNRDIQVMDLSTDKFGKLSLKDALNNLQCFEPKDGNGDEFVEGCNPRKIYSSPYVTGRNFVESPFETQTTQGVRRISVFGEMEERFLSKAAFGLMLQQLEKKGLAAALAENSALQYDDEPDYMKNTNKDRIVPLFTQGLGKRGQEEVSASPVVYATLTTGSLATEPTGKQMIRTLGLTEMEAHNNEKLAFRDPAAAKYLATLTKSLDVTTKTAIAQRTFGLLVSGNEALIKEEVVLPLQESLGNTGGLAEERKLQKDTLIKRLAQASEMVTAGLQDQAVPTATQQTKTGFFTLDEVANASKVEYLDPATGKVVATQKPFNLDSPLGFVRQQLALNRAGVQSRTGNIVDVGTLTHRGEGDSFFFWEYLNQSIANSNDGKKYVNILVKRIFDFYYSGVDKALVFALLAQKVNKKFLHFLADNDIYFPFTVLIARPWICVQTYCVIIGTGGRALGATYIQNPDVGKGSDETSKILEFHVTLWNKAVVHHPGLITVWDDRALRSYMGGGSLRFISYPEYVTMKGKEWKIPQTDKRGSLFALLCGYDESKPLPDVINFRTKRLMKDSDPDKMNDVPPLVCVEDNKWFKDYIDHTPLDNHPMQTWVQQQTNALCFQATQLLFNPYEGKFSCVIYSNNNHFGPNMYAGMMRDLIDGNLILKDQGYNNPSQYTQWYSM